MSQCIICKSDSKNQPSSCLERLCCSKQIKKEPLITLLCCSQMCHLSCLKTAILAQRDANPNQEYDQCIHCQRKLQTYHPLDLPFKSIQEFKEYQKEECQKKSIYYYAQGSFLIILILLAISITLQVILAKPKYQELCQESNLTIVSTKGYYTHEELCRKCLGSDKKNGDGIKCPRLISMNILIIMLNALAFPGLLIMIMIPILRDYYISNSTKYRYMRNIFRSFLVCSLVRTITITVFYTIILPSVNQIDSFDQLYQLQVQHAVLDVVIGSIVFLIYITIGIYYGSKECYSPCKESCLDCFNSIFHTSHYNNNSISDLNLPHNNDDLKKYDIRSQSDIV